MTDTWLLETARQADKAYAEWSAHDTITRLAHKLPADLVVAHRKQCRRCTP